MFKTSDIYFAAFIIAKSNKLVSQELIESPKKKVFFIFELNKIKSKELKTDFFGGNGMINVTQYMTALKNLKNLCFQIG